MIHVLCYLLLTILNSMTLFGTCCVAFFCNVAPSVICTGTLLTSNLTSHTQQTLTFLSQRSELSNTNFFWISEKKSFFFFCFRKTAKWLWRSNFVSLELALHVTIFRDTATCIGGWAVGGRVIGPNISENPAASDFSIKVEGRSFG